MPTLLGTPSLTELPSATSVTVPYPAGIRAGEKLVAFLAGPSNTVATDLPSGWTAHTSRAGNEAGANNAITVWERTATGTETGSVTMVGTGTAARIAGVIFRVADVDATTAFDVTTVVGAQTSNAAYTSPSITPVTADTLLVHVLSINSGATATITAAPAGTTQVITNPAPDNTTAGRKVYVYTEGRPTAGATGTRSWTQSGTTQWTYIGIAFRPTATPTVPAQPTGPTGAWTSVFSDDFAGASLDTTKWTALDSWSMNGVQAMARNVSQSGGNLILTLESSAFGAAVSSDPFDSASRYDVQVGDYVEAKVYMPGDGSIVYNWPAFWTSGQNWPTNGEHDVAEVLAKQVAVNYHYGTSASPQQSGPWAQAGYWGNAWHTYGVHRKATTADVYWDGRLVRSYSTSDSGGGHTILLNVGVSGTPLITGAASQIKVDYVKAWRPTPTTPTLSSPPPAWASTGNAASITTAAFTPPTGALLLSQSMFGTSNTARTEVTDTVTGSTSAWTKIQHQNAGAGLVDSNWATVTSSVSTTVRTTWPVAFDGALALFVITGHNASTPIGQSGKGVSQTGGGFSFTVTPTTPGSRIFVSYCAVNGANPPTSPQLTLYGTAQTPATSSTYASYTSAALSGTTTFTLTGGTSNAGYNWVEVLPATATGGGGTTWDLSDPKLKEAILRFVSTVENGTQSWWTNFGYIEYGAGIGDTRGYTGGISGWTSATFDMNVLVKAYQTAKPGNVLAKWIPTLNTIDAMSTQQQRHDASLTQLGSAFVADWQTAATDPVFQATQISERDRVYWDPAYTQAVTDGLSPLGLLHYHDALVNHGPGTDSGSFGGLITTTKSTNAAPAQGGNEGTYLAAFNNARQTVLEGWGDYQTDGRVPACRAFVAAGNFGLVTPYSWSMYGTTHTMSAWPDPYVLPTVATGLTYTAEGGTVGATPTTSDALAGNAFNVITPGAGTITFESDHPARGTRGLRFATTATAASPLVEWTSTSTGVATTTDYTRVYGWLPALPTGFTSVIRLYSGTTAVGRLQISTTGTLRYFSDALTTPASLGSTTWSLPTGALFRLEMRVAHATAGTVDLRLFTGANVHGTTPDQTTTISGNTGANADRVQFGVGANNTLANYSIYLDEFGWSATDWLGPASAAGGTTYESVVLSDGPKVFLVGQAGGTMAERVASRAVTISGTPTVTTAPDGLPALKFDGGAYAQLGDDAALSVSTTGILTVEAWIRPDVNNFPGAQDSTDGPYTHWIGKGRYTPMEVEWAGRMYSRDTGTRPNRISGYAFNATGGEGAGSYFQDTVAPGEWIHWALVIDTVNKGADGWGTTTLYKNGVQRDQDTLGAPYNITPTNTASPLFLGAAMGSYFTGVVDRVAVYDYKVPQARLAAHVSAMTTLQAASGQRAAVSVAGATDTVTRSMTVVRTAASAAGAVDSVTATRGKSVASASGATDSVTRIMDMVRSVEDWAPATDTVTWSIDRPDIQNYQFVFDTEPWVPFGLGQTIVVENFNPGTAETRNQDVLSPTADVRWFGTDRRTPPTWTFDLYTDVEDAAQALGWAQNMEEVWDAEDVRSTPNAVLALRYRIADRTRRVFGRPGDFTPIPSYVRTGRVHMTADFRLAEHTYYEDAEERIRINTIPSDTSASGFTFPITFPLTIGAQGDSPYVEMAHIRGKRPTWIDVTFYGPSLDPWVMIGGQRWQLRGELGAQDSIRMSGKPWQTGLLRNDGAWMAGMLGPQARLSQLRLKPGSYPVKYGAYDPTGTSRAEVAWRAAYGTM